MKEIKIIHITGSQINGRSIIDSLFVEYSREYILDFDGVTFISRSASHELLSKIDAFKEKGIKVILTNLSFTNDIMLKRVETSRKSGEKLATFVNRLNLNTTSELDNFILSI